MRYHLIPLGLAFLLAACGQDATGPSTTPQVDAGRNIPRAEPVKEPILCLKRRVPVFSIAEKSGVEALRNHPVCPAL
jgi:hypothetical protein